MTLLFSWTRGYLVNPLDKRVYSSFKVDLMSFPLRFFMTNTYSTFTVVQNEKQRRLYCHSLFVQGTMSATGNSCPSCVNQGRTRSIYTCQGLFSAVVPLFGCTFNLVLRCAFIWNVCPSSKPHCAEQFLVFPLCPNRFFITTLHRLWHSEASRGQKKQDKNYSCCSYGCC